MIIEIDKKQLRKVGITFGLLLGLALTILSIVSFYIMISTSSVIVISSVPFIFSIVFPIILVVILCFNFRKNIEGFWTFKQAATGIFIMFFVAFAVQFLLRDQLFARVIEPNMVEKTQTAMTSAVTSFLEKSKASQDDIDKKMDDIQKQFDAQKNVSIGKQIEGVGISIIFIFVIAIIFAAFFKKEGQVYNPNNDPII
ncbi:DUF4199 domain-containing protein [Mucilaginibacter sp. SP1R1]|uniref:DUF4199 domain-containing protein n=1 Tax=Mucilaginibacter sp. SP1R1 TaxID=2723091 RepID=UPI00161A714A|nr:DUF4199 domain-containing protein [Mucilaginibacter sp. SP1R1]MBB6149795.1 tetrahydromethanopterin S-methyltransferase subunit G [Mucilaginibacter sp. SP1R1]